MFKRDYEEFVRDRRRWKSDFDVATHKAYSSFDYIEEMLNGCLAQNKVNIQAIKMLLDVQMIAQICERQDVEDK